MISLLQRRLTIESGPDFRELLFSGPEARLARLLAVSLSA